MIRVKTNDLVGMNWAEWQMHPSEEFAVKGAKKLDTSWRELFFPQNQWYEMSLYTI